MTEPAVPSPRWSLTTLREAAAAGDPGLAAATLAGANIPVFPCVPGGKQPLTRRGFHDATPDPDQVRAWWRHTPEANVGLPTGAPSGVVVVDVDRHAGGSGYGAFGRARAAGVLGAWGWLVRTPSGGIHAYYRPARSDLRCWQVPGEHVDFRGDGGYVVVPPSRVLGDDGISRGYEVVVVSQRPPRPLDADALRAFLDPPRADRIGRPPRSLPAAGSRPDRLAAWVAARPEGARNAGLFWAACRMAEDGQRYDTTLSVLGEAAHVAGLPEREAETTIRSAYRIASRLAPPTTPGSRLGPTRTPTNTTEGVRL